MLANSLIELDRAHLVHPVASWRGHEKAGVRMLTSAKGATVTDATGQTLIDGFAGLWCVNAGYGQDSVIEAATRQLRDLPYATGYFGLGSEPPIRLAARLADHAPGDLDHVYFTLGGSDAVDSTVRFARYYWNARGLPQKDQFLSLEQGYHGSSTVGAGLTALPVFHAGFGLPMDWQHKIPSHYTYRNPVGGDPAAVIAASVAQLRAKVAEVGGPDRVAAFYAEPIQGSGGVLVPPAGWMKAMRDVCTELDILFIADEVITGFGRTGQWFGTGTYGLRPDIVSLAKGLTSAYFPMSASMISDRIWQVLADTSDATGAFMHGFTYSGHPVGSAIALANLDLIEREGLVDNAARLAPRLLAALRDRIGDNPFVGDIRGVGLMAGVEFVADRATRKPFRDGTAPHRIVSRHAAAQGVLARALPFLPVNAFSPPLSITAADIDEAADRYARALEAAMPELAGCV